jgi:hypothetical protein
MVIRKCVAAIGVVVLLAGCGDDDANEPPETPSDEYISECDEHGNRVYITEDDKNATPNIFVVPNDCEPG